MRVLMLSWEFPPHNVGGLGRHVAEIAPELAAQDIDLHIVTPQIGAAPSLECLGKRLTVHRVPIEPSDRTELVARVQHTNRGLEQAGLRLDHHLHFDLIHAHDWLAAYSGVALKYALQRPLVATIHSLEHGRMQGHLGSEQSLAINGIEAWVTHEAWRTITVSHYMAQQVHTTFDVPLNKIDVIYNGVTTSTTPALSPAARAAVRRQYVADDEQLVCSVGRLVYEKGAHLLIAALAQVHAQLPATKLVIAGTGPMSDELRRQAEAAGVADQVIFAGYISDEARNDLFAVADVAVFPSLYEPFGIVALEAMSYACPVVASATGGLAEIVRPHETGILAEPGNPNSLAWGIVHTLQHPEWAAARARNALHELETTYSWTRIATRTIKTYHQTLMSWRQNVPQQPAAAPGTLVPGNLTIAADWA